MLTFSQIAVLLVTSFVRVSGVPIFSSNRNGVIESLRVMAVNFRRIGRIWFMTWCTSEALLRKDRAPKLFGMSTTEIFWYHKPLVKLCVSFPAIKMMIIVG